MGSDYFSDEDIALASEILEQSMRAGKVDAVRFRATHDEHLDCLDRLEKVQFLRRNIDNSYTISLYGILNIDNSITKKLRRNFEILFAILRRRYKENPGVSCFVSELQIESKLSMSQTVGALQYMLDASIAGYSTDLTGPNAYVIPSESVLRFKSFNDALEQHRRTWNFNARNPFYIRFLDSESAGSVSVKQKRKSLQGLPASKMAPKLPVWLGQVNDNVRHIMEEVYKAKEIGLRALPCMGLRTAIDLALMENVGDVGGFEQKLREFEKKGNLSDRDRKIVMAALDAGHASAHRGYLPMPRDLDAVIHIVENLLQRIFVLDGAADQLEATVPKRQRQKKPTSV